MEKVVLFLMVMRPSIKDHEHLRCVKKARADIQLSESIRANKNQKVFLVNEKNKYHLILLISQYLRDDARLCIRIFEM